MGDWMCMKTTMFMYDWLKFEDIYSVAYAVKCDVTYRRWWGRKKGDPYPLGWKLWSGGLALVGLVGLVYAPLLVYVSDTPSLFGGVDEQILKARLNVWLVPGGDATVKRPSPFNLLTVDDATTSVL